MNATAWIVHQIAGRLRLRIPQRRKDVAFFNATVDFLQTLPGVTLAKANPATASLLIEFDASTTVPAQLKRYLREHQIEMDYGDPPMQAARPSIKKGIDQLDQYIGLMSQQATDLRSIGVLFFLALSVLQMARGQVLAPATSLLWYALYLLRDPNNHPSDE